MHFFFKLIIEHLNSSFGNSQKALLLTVDRTYFEIENQGIINELFRE